MVHMVSTKDREVGFFDILHARSCKFERIKRPPIRVGGGSGASSNSHDIVLMVYVVVFEFDSIWVDYIFLVNNDLLTILIMIRESQRVVELIAVWDYGIWMHQGKCR